MGPLLTKSFVSRPKAAPTPSMRASLRQTFRQTFRAIEKCNEFQAPPSYGFGVFGAQDSDLRDKCFVGTRHTFFSINGQSFAISSGILGPQKPQIIREENQIFLFAFFARVAPTHWKISREKLPRMPLFLREKAKLHKILVILLSEKCNESRGECLLKNNKIINLNTYITNLDHLALLGNS